MIVDTLWGLQVLRKGLVFCCDGPLRDSSRHCHWNRGWAKLLQLANRRNTMDCILKPELLGPFRAHFSILDYHLYRLFSPTEPLCNAIPWNPTCWTEEELSYAFICLILSKKQHQPFHQPPTNPKRDQTVGLFSDIPVTGSGSFCLSRIVNQPPVGGPLVSRPFQARPGPVEQQSVDVEIPSGTLTLLPGISPFLVGDIGDTSSKGPFAIAMLAYQSVISPGYALKIGSYEKYESSNSFECLHFHWGTV